MQAIMRALSIVDGRQTNISEGVTVPELAEMLIRDYRALDAISLDGGGSTTLAIDAPEPHIVNVPSDNPPWAVGSNEAIFVRRAGM
jgi:exopolysaccharide biosynthesis protein